MKPFGGLTRVARLAPSLATSFAPSRSRKGRRVGVGVDESMPSGCFVIALRLECTRCF